MKNTASAMRRLLAILDDAIGGVPPSLPNTQTVKFFSSGVVDSVARATFASDHMRLASALSSDRGMPILQPRTVLLLSPSYLYP